MNRIPELDSLRGLAAVGVVWYHVRRDELFWYWTSMDFFFVLSSYLIARIMIQKASRPGFLRAFYTRRIIRIWPLYYATILAVWLFQTSGRLLSSLSAHDLGFWTYYSQESLLLYLTFSQNIDLYFYDEATWDYPLYLRHLWSLAVEEQFYVLAPLILLGLRKLSSPTATGLTFLSLISLGVWSRYDGHDFTLLTWHVDALVLGSGLALLLHHCRTTSQAQHVSRASIVLGAVSLAASTPYLYEGYRAYHSGPNELDAFIADMNLPFTALAFNLFWTSVVAWFALNSGRTGTAFLRIRLFVYFGASSYSLYLCHGVILTIGKRLLQTYFQANHPLIWGVLCLPAVFAASHLLYKYIDRPAQTFRSSITTRAISSSV